TRRPMLRRNPWRGLLEMVDVKLMIDAGRTDLCERFAPGELQGIILTHYHMDHVMGLFQLRWGANLTIPVYGPDDPVGCDDLYKHPGILDFRPPFKPFKTPVMGRLGGQVLRCHSQ